MYKAWYPTSVSRAVGSKKDIISSMMDSAASAESWKHSPVEMATYFVAIKTIKKTFILKDGR